MKIFFDFFFIIGSVLLLAMSFQSSSDYLAFVGIFFLPVAAIWFTRT